MKLTTFNHDARYREARNVARTVLRNAHIECALADWVERFEFSKEFQTMCYSSGIVHIYVPKDMEVAEFRAFLAECVRNFGVRFTREFDSTCGEFSWRGIVAKPLVRGISSVWIIIRNAPKGDCRIWKTKKEVEVFASDCGGELTQ